MKTANDCNSFRSEMPGLLLDGDVLNREPGLAQHLASCAACADEWNDLQATLAVLDEWKAPEPSPFFDTKLHARLREAVSSPPEGFFERARSFFLFSTGRQLRPALAGALALALVVGGGSGILELHQHQSVTQAGASATLNDLKILDNNEQALQQMDQLLDENGGDEEGAPPTT